jgi:hypothetical protein
MEDRIVKSLLTGELFIETASNTDLWKSRLNAWMANHSLPCPLPVGHKIFSEPMHYQATLLKAYKCKCGICGKEFEHFAEFLGGCGDIPASDGWRIELNQCGANHSVEERQAWWKNKTEGKN